jgi:hypothetical protein
MGKKPLARGSPDSAKERQDKLKIEMIDVYANIQNNMEQEEIQKKVDELEADVKKLKSEVEVLKKRTQLPKTVNWAYVGVFAFLILITALLFWRGWAEKAQVSIDYNIGEIIAGILVGVGAVTAGVTYAKAHLK